MAFKKNGWIIGMTLALALGLAACGGKGAGDGASNKDGKSAEELAPEFSYVAASSAFPDDVNVYDMVATGKAIYGLQYDYEKDNYSLNKMEVQSGTIGEKVKILELDANTNVSKFNVDADGNVYAIQSSYPEAPGEDAPEEEIQDYYNNVNQNTKQCLVKYDAQGQKVFETEFTDVINETEYFYPQHLVTDAQGRTYVYSSELGVLLFDANGTYVGKIDVASMNSWISEICVGKDGKAYAVTVNYDNGGAKGVLSELDFDGKKFGKTYKNIPCSYGSTYVCVGKDCDYYLSDGISAYEYSLEKEEATKLFAWIDIDVDGNGVSGIFTSEEGKLCAIVNDYENGTAELASLSKVRTEEIAKRDVIVVGSIYENSDLSRKIIAFNKSNDQYRIKMKAYMDANDWSDKSYNDAIANLTNDILSGNGPDILDLGNLDVENLASKGALADLMPYLEKSSVLDKNDFFEALLNAATYDGKLTYVPSGFTLETLAAKTSIVGNRTGWTLADLLKLKKEYPNAELMEYGTQENVLTMLMMLNKKAYVDTVKGECHFDTQEFKDLLAFAKTFPQEYDYENQRLTPYKLRDDQLILVDAYIYDFQEVQSIGSYFGDEPFTFIGYPTSEGGNGCLISANNTYGISEKSQHKDAAWSFLESTISEEANDTWRYSGFSSLKSVYEAQKQDALNVEYLYDENGEILKDEAGNPIYANGGGGGWIMTNDLGESWEYEYRPVTKEEVDMVEKLLNGATTVSYGMDTELNKIIFEEAQSYFNGDKTVDEVAAIIQNRVNLYIKENY